MTLLRRVGAVAIIAALPLWQGAWQPAWPEPVGGPTKKSPASVCDRPAFRVVVDVGHTAESPGARSARGVGEYDFNLRLATLIERELAEGGFGRAALLVTDGPTRKGLAQRVERANRSSADLFLSIHHDSVPNSFLETWEYEGEEHGFSDRFKGHSLFISYNNADPGGSLLFARLLGKQLKARGLQYTPHYTQKFMGHRQRELVDPETGVYRYDQLIVLKNTQMPAVLLEAGSIINRDEELALSAPERPSLISAAVTDAVESFCALRRPRNSERVAGQPGAPAKQAPAAGAAQRATAKMR